MGVVTLWGQSHLPGEWSAIANSGAVWLLPATLVGAVMPTDLRAALAGALTLVVAVAVFYAAVPFLVAGASSAPRGVVIWSVTAVVAGPVFGVAGRWIRGDRSRLRAAAAALIGGSFTAEGVIRLLTPPSEDRSVAILMIVAGLLLSIAIGRSTRERLLGVLGQPVVVLVTFGVYKALDQAFLRS